jgi:spore coat polysaccharide biosynthesis protein SpsF
MTTAIVIQSRFSSTRLPGKAIRPMAGKPMLSWVIERMLSVQIADTVIVATSQHPTDDALEEVAVRSGARCFRGELDDVLGRFVGVCRTFDVDAVVRISGDSPLIDPALVARAIGIFRQERPDVVSNVWPRSYPKGQSVEVVSRSTLERAHVDIVGDSREHVTSGMYRSPSTYRIVPFVSATNNQHLQLSVDTEDEFRLIERLMQATEGDHLKYGVDEWIALWKRIVGGQINT